MRPRLPSLSGTSPLAPLAGPAGALAAALALLLVTLPAPAGAIIFYEVGVGYRQPEFFLFHQDTVPRSIDTPIGSCPPPGTFNGLCGLLRSEAGNAGGRLFLRSGARYARTNVDPNNRESAAYADTRITITEIGGYVGVAPRAAFYFGLSGTLSTTATDPNVFLQAFASATLQAGSGGGVQCFGETDCLPGAAPYVVTVTDWMPTQGFTLRLRSDAAAVAPFGNPGGWDAEVVADFADTLEVLAIQVQDENGDPMPGVTLTALDANGDPLLTFPNEPEGVPEPGEIPLVLTGGLLLAAAGHKRRA